MDKNKFGALLCNCRKEKGWKQKDLAEKLHISDKAISRWETGSSLPDIDMMCRISKVFSIPLNDVLKFKIGDSSTEEIEVLASELEMSNKKNKRKRIKIIIVSAITILFLCLIIFFTNTYNKIKVYDVGVIGESIYSTYGVYINTNVQDILYLGRLLIENEDSLTSTTADIYIKQGKKEITLQHFDSINRNLEFDLSKSYFDIDELEDYFGKTYIRVNGKNKNGKDVVLKGKINFVIRFKNSKLFYLDKDYEKRNNSNPSKTESEIRKNLKEMRFIETSNNIFENNKKHITYLMNEKQLKYEYENKKSSINYKYVYFDQLKKIHVLVIDINNTTHSTIEEYTYDLTTNNIDCAVGKCQNYQEILDLLSPYIEALF